MRKLKVWKTVFFCFIPLSIAYQSVWSWCFAKVSPEFWRNELSYKVLLGKSISEVVIYTSMLWFLALYTQSSKPLVKLIPMLVLSFLVLYTLINVIERIVAP